MGTFIARMKAIISHVYGIAWIGVDPAFRVIRDLGVIGIGQINGFPVDHAAAEFDGVIARAPRLPLGINVEDPTLLGYLQNAFGDGFQF